MELGSFSAMCDHKGCTIMTDEHPTQRGAWSVQIEPDEIRIYCFTHALIAENKGLAVTWIPTIEQIVEAEWYDAQGISMR